ncbi:MAG TPA: hypothetical protein VGI16_02175 [Candidatus Acidoferrum sp.]|jgi:hypothetical protein
MMPPLGSSGEKRVRRDAVDHISLCIDVPVIHEPSQPWAERRADAAAKKLRGLEGRQAAFQSSV